MSANSTPRIAIPMPHSGDREYAERSIPQYERAVELAGGEPVRIPLDQSADEVIKIVSGCDGILLPGSSADVDPARFGAPRSAHAASADASREAVDEILLRNAYDNRKPILGICYGMQSLNVYRCGSLIQHIPDFLSEDLRTRVDHEAGKKVAVAHSVEIEKNSKLAEIVSGNDNSGLSRVIPAEGGASTSAENKLVVPVNSSHHQSAGTIGDGLSISARCLEDGIIEAVEGTSPDHFVIAVQWHPERSVDLDEASRAIFDALVKAAKLKQSKLGN